MARNRLIYLLALIGATAFYCCYREWMSWILFLMAVAALPLSLMLSLPGALTLRLGLDCPAAVPLGQAGHIRLNVSGRLPAPPVRGKFRVTRLTTGETWILEDGAALPTDHCGGLKVEPVKLRLLDYFGILRLPLRQPGAASVLVRPEAVPVEAPPVLHRYLARAWKPKPGGGFAENHELRLYRPGDSLNLVHWKLTAKTGKLVVREAMDPIRGRALLTVDLCGTPEELDRKLGRLLWMSNYLLNRNIPHTLRCLTGNGVENFPVTAQAELTQAMDRLLCCPCASGGSIAGLDRAAAWQYHVGGEAHES